MEAGFETLILAGCLHKVQHNVWYVLNHKLPNLIARLVPFTAYQNHIGKWSHNQLR